MSSQGTSVAARVRLALTLAIVGAAAGCAGTPPPPPPPDAGPYPADYKEVIWAAITRPHWRIASVTIKSAEITKPVQGQIVRQRMVLFTRVVEPTAYTGWIVCPRIRIDSGLLVNHQWPVLGYLINRGQIIGALLTDVCETQPYERWTEIEGRTYR